MSSATTTTKMTGAPNLSSTTTGTTLAIYDVPDDLKQLIDAAVAKPDAALVRDFKLNIRHSVAILICMFDSVSLFNITLMLIEAMKTVEQIYFLVAATATATTTGAASTTAINTTLVSKGAIKKQLVMVIMSIMCTYLIEKQMNLAVGNSDQHDQQVQEEVIVFQQLQSSIQSFLLYTMSSVIDHFISIENGQVSIRVLDQISESTSKCFSFFKCCKS